MRIYDFYDDGVTVRVRFDSILVTGSYKDTLRFFFTVTDVEGDTDFV